VTTVKKKPAALRQPPPKSAQKKGPASTASIGTRSGKKQGQLALTSANTIAEKPPTPKENGGDAVKTPATHPHRPQDWTEKLAPEHFGYVDSRGIEDAGAFALAGHNRSAIKGIYEGVSAVFSPAAPYVAGDIVCIRTTADDHYVGRIFFPNDSQVIIVADHPMYHGSVIERAEVAIIAALVERRIVQPHGPACQDWIQYASEGPQPPPAITDNYMEREKRVDSRITAERVLAHFKTTGKKTSPCPALQALGGWDFTNNRSRHESLLTSDELRRLGITPPGDPGFAARRINVNNQTV
jgi:hypothetical protein